MTATHSDRHFCALWGTDDKALKLRIACGSGADVVVSQLRGALLMELEDEAFNMAGGPLTVECERHGHYIGLVQLLPEAAPQTTGRP